MNILILPFMNCYANQAEYYAISAQTPRRRFSPLMAMFLVDIVSVFLYNIPCCGPRGMV